MDWVKDIAIAGCALGGVEKMLKIFKLWRAASHNQQAALGLTVKNGEYKSIVQTLGRIEKRIDTMGKEMRSGHDVLGARITAIEDRLST